MPRTTSLQKAQEALADLGLVISPETRVNRLGEVMDNRLWVLNPEAVTAISLSKNPDRDNDLPEGRTVGMALIFDDEGKFYGANYAHLYWDDLFLEEGEAAHWEVRCSAGTWSPDERTLKATLSFLTYFSPVGTAKSRQEAQEAAEAAQKAEEERQADLAALNQAILDNRDGRRWAGKLAEEISYTRRRVVSQLHDLASKAEKLAAKVEAGERFYSSDFYATTATDIMAGLAKLEALEAAAGAFSPAVLDRAKTYGYTLPDISERDF